MTMPLEAVFPCTGVGSLDDFESSSGNRVTDVKLADDGKYIYMENLLIPEEPINTKLRLYLQFANNGGVSDPTAYVSPQWPNILTIEYTWADAPSSTGWTLAQAQDVEVAIGSDDYFDIVQSFTTRVPDPIDTWNILSVGVRAVIQFLVEGNQVQRRCLKLEKVIKYEIV